MDRLKRSFSFWASLLAVVALLPVTVRGQNPCPVGIKKALYGGKLFAGTKQVGSSQFIIFNQRQANGNVKTTMSYMVSTFGLPNQQVQSVWLAPPDNAWQIPLCTTGGDPEDDCEYSGDGNLALDGTLVPAQILAANADNFIATLTGLQLKFKLSNGTSVIAEGTLDTEILRQCI